MDFKLDNITKKLRFLLVTGEKSFDEINSISEKVNGNKDLKIETHVYKVPISVSAFITENHIREMWGKIENKKFDCILIPGFIPWDAKNLSDEFKIPIAKGTRFSGYLYDLFSGIRELELSTSTPADSKINQRSKSKIADIIKKRKEAYDSGNYGDIEENFLEFSKNEEKIYVGSEFPPLIFAEIVNAPKYSIDNIVKKAKYYLDSGADVIDIGTIYGQKNIQFIQQVIPVIKEKFNCFISIDSVDIDEITAAIEVGVDFILSIDGGNINRFLKYTDTHPVSKKLGLILVPLEGENHAPIINTEDKIDHLFNLATRLNSEGFENIFFDPLLQTPISPGLVESLYDYLILQRRCEILTGLKYPLFMGFNNVFELMDVDSSGVIGLLSSIALEIGVGGILTTEYSNKCLGAVRETKNAIDLSFYAKVSKSPPINLGIDAFSVKNKTVSIVRTEIPKEIINLKDPTQDMGLPSLIQKALATPSEFIHDKMGYFKIFVDYFVKQIELLFYPSEECKRKLGLIGPLLVIGEQAEIIYKTLDKLGLVSELSHAFYLGKELGKAEFCLKSNAHYHEDV